VVPDVVVGVVEVGITTVSVVGVVAMVFDVLRYC
jgi:hypothetical protein